MPEEIPSPFPAPPVTGIWWLTYAPDMLRLYLVTT